MQMQIVPRYIDPPKAGKTNWTVKDERGTIFSVKPDVAPRLQKGQAVNVEYHVNEFNGRSFNMLDAVLDGSAPASSSAPAPRRNGNGHARTGDESESIFITGIVGRAMGSGQFQVNDIKLLALAAHEAWQELRSKKSEAPY